MSDHDQGEAGFSSFSFHGQVTEQRYREALILLDRAETFVLSDPSGQGRKLAADLSEFLSAEKESKR